MGVEAIFGRLHRTTGGRLALHVVFWLLFFAVQFYLVEISLANYNNRLDYIVPLKNTLLAALAFYPLVYGVWLRLWARRRYLAGIVLLVLVVVLYAVADYALEQVLIVACAPCMDYLRATQPGYYRYLHNDVKTILLSRILSAGVLYQAFVNLALPLGIKVGREFIRQRLLTLQLRQENTQLEFNFLKAQVNPHFLFNTLNNIYALILQDRKTESAATVERLATFMRYTLYDCNSHAVSIGKEVGMLKDYIALEQIRLNQTPVRFTCRIDNEAHTLPPLLLMPAVENAFKFCREEKGRESWINIDLALTDGQLRFGIENTYAADRAGQPAGGIGLQNLKKRLEQYYPGRHRMEIDRTPNVFKLHLNLNLAPA